MDIFSKRDGPRPEDVKARKLIKENSGTIRQLADTISNGGFTKMKQDEARRQQQPKPEGLIIHDLKAPSKSDFPEPYVKVSLNNRVLLVDRSNGRQLQLLGHIRGSSFARRFMLATKENGYFSPVDDEIRAAIGALDNVELSQDMSEADLVNRLTELLRLETG